MLFNFQQIFKVLLHFVSEITEPLTMGAIVSELSKRARTFNEKMFIYAFQLIMTCWIGADICICLDTLSGTIIGVSLIRIRSPK